MYVIRAFTLLVRFTSYGPLLRGDLVWNIFAEGPKVCDVLGMVNGDVFPASPFVSPGFVLINIGLFGPNGFCGVTSLGPGDGAKLFIGFLGVLFSVFTTDVWVAVGLEAVELVAVEALAASKPGGS